MKKHIITFALLCFSILGFAHNPDASTLVLAEQKNNVWVLQINASLTAFQQEVRTHYADTPYKTPEEFQEMVLEHIKNNLHLFFNNGEQISLDKGVVKLGHETKVIFEVLNIPASLESVVVQNTIFKDISRNKSTFLLFKDGFEKSNFTLSQSNDHTVSLVVKENTFVEVVQQEATSSSKYVIIILIAVIAIAFIIQQFVFLKKKHKKKP
ncbi:hypothetical protein J8L85_11695 [Maribacter sp. MMG018]|uniref:hypothetical protein n=1 Tax=Maribacter sp. MMG018 TaxID=2822688 RepID=UPI001B389FD1|nr:hypothetical protein [Maribacter sp. MMG018]MBQ4915105.1 hypothetical protein [Maribacter sp. MMG018]